MKNRINILNQTDTYLEIQKTAFAFREDLKNRLAFLAFLYFLGFGYQLIVFANQPFSFFNFYFLLGITFFSVLPVFSLVKVYIQKREGCKLTLDKEANGLSVNNNILYAFKDITQITLDHSYDSDGQFYGYKLEINIANGEIVSVDQSKHKSETYAVAELLAQFTGVPLEVLNEK